MAVVLKQRTKGDGLQLVSVVIPTWNRPLEVQSAALSALKQTYQNLEVIVVIDGPQAATENALKTIQDPRLRVITNPENVGLAESRNVGVRAARGEWVAFLDDDDLWLPEKIERQIQAAASLEGDHSFIVTRYVEKTSTIERVWPETLPASMHRFSEYLYCQRGMLLPSTFMASKELMRDIPFTKGLRHIEDIDWLLRAADDPRTKVACVPEPLVIYNNVAVTGRESHQVPWETFYVWGFNHRKLFTRFAFSLYIAKAVVPRAKDAGVTFRELCHLLSAATFLGSFHPKSVFYFFASTIFTRESKRKVREMLSPVAREARRRASNV